MGYPGANVYKWVQTFTNTYKRLQTLTNDYKYLKTSSQYFFPLICKMEKRLKFIDNGIYHVYNRGNGVEPVFRNFANYDYFLRKYYEFMDPHWETLAYCLMPTHFHCLVRVKLGASEFVGQKQRCVKAYADFCNGYVQAFNKQHGRKGSLFMRNFKRKSVEEEIYLRKLVCYIHNNPVKDGYVRTAQEWHHSSFYDMIKMSEAECTSNEVVNWFGSKDDFLHAHIAELSPGSIDIKSSTVVDNSKVYNMVYNKLKPDDFLNPEEWMKYDQAG